ncbi:MAG: ASCH domain-containing protein [Opitutales bacterium]
MKRRKRMQFWGRDENDDSLVCEIERGEKTATVCKADTYNDTDGDYDDGGCEVGELVDVYDLKKNLRCTIEITAVYRVNWSEIPEKLWRGEACRSAQHFKDAHIACWPEYDITDDFEMMATHFNLIEVHGPPKEMRE